MISILNIEFFTLSNVLVASISNGVSHSLGIFNNYDNTVLVGNIVQNSTVIGSVSYSVLTYSTVISELKLKERLEIDAVYGFEYYVEKYTAPYCTQFRVSYYKWSEALNMFEFFRNILIKKNVPAYLPSNGIVRNTCGCNSFNGQYLNGIDNGVPSGCGCNNFNGWNG